MAELEWQRDRPVVQQDFITATATRLSPFRCARQQFTVTSYPTVLIYYRNLLRTRGDSAAAKLHSVQRITRVAFEMHLRLNVKQFGPGGGSPRA